MTTTEAQNKAFVLEAFDTLFNKRDYAAAERFWSPAYIQHSAHIAPGREGLFELVKAAPKDPMALSQKSSSQMTCPMWPQPMILESQDAMSVVDGATIEPRIRIIVHDREDHRCCARLSPSLRLYLYC